MPISLPSGAAPFTDLTTEIRIQRLNTERFIVADPLVVALTPSVVVALPSGGTIITDGVPRMVQKFRLIPRSHTERPRESQAGATTTSSGKERRHDFTLLGVWDALMEPGDWWEDERGERWIIDEMVPHNGYETRGLVTAHGKTR
jgi:hypothetical protein